MRVWSAILLGALLLLPAAASAQVVGREQAAELYARTEAHPAECSRLRRQIDHFSGMYERAVAFENELWMLRLQNHLGFLLQMQAQRCPSDVPVDTTGEAFKTLIKLAAKAAVTYFTFGAAGF